MSSIGCAKRLLSLLDDSSPPPIEGTIGQRYAIEGQPFRVWFADEDRTVIVLSAAGFVSFIDLESHDVQRTEDFGSATFAGQLSEDRQTLVVWSYYNSILHFISVSEQAHKAKMTIGRNIGQVKFLKGGERILVTSVGTREIMVVDYKRHEILHTKKMDKAVGHVAISEDQDWLVASGGVYRSRKRSGSNLLVLGAQDDNFGQVRGERSLPIGHHPRGIDTLDETGHVLVADRENSTIIAVSLIEPDSPIYRLDMGRRPERIYRSNSRDERLILSQAEAIVERIRAEPGAPMRHLGRAWLSGTPWGLFPVPDSEWVFATIPGREIVSRRYHGGPKVFHGRKARPGEASDSIALIDASQMVEVELIETDDGPVDIAISEKKTTVAVACAAANMVDILH
jgi:hypothetical protein